MEYGMKIDKLIHNKHHELAQAHNLTLDQFHLLLYIARQENPRTVGEIALIFNNAQNTMSEKITRIEEKGLLCKVKDESDKRIYRVVVTEEARSLITNIKQKAGSEFVFNSLSKMKEETVDSLLNNLKELIDNLD